MEETTLNLRDLWKIIKRRKLIILSIALSCMFLGLAISFIPKKGANIETKNELYKSTASIIVGTFPDTKSDNIKDITILNQQIVKTYGAIANSRTVAEKTIKELSLDIKTDKFIDNIKVNTNAEAQVVTILYANKEEKDVEKVTDTYLKIFMEEARKIYPEAKLKVLDAPSKAEKISKEDFDKIGMPQNPNQPTQTTVTENKGKSKKLIMVVSALLGLIVGLGTVFIMEYVDNSIRKKEEAEVILGVSAISEIKKDKEEADEDYKILRTTLQYGTKNSSSLEIQGRQPKNNVFMITSPSKGDGKTTTAVNLAISFAEAGFKTLIIDANGRNPMIHTMLEVVNNKGLSNILSGEILNEERCKKDKLHIVTWGTSNINPADAFVKGNINEVIKKLKEEFDYVIVDTPSIVKYADVQILSQIVDKIVFVLSEDKTDRDEAIKAKQLLSAIDIKEYELLWISNI